MSDIVTNEATPLNTESEKPVQEIEEIKFPPFPDVTDADLEDVSDNDEKEYYKQKFPDLNDVKKYKLHCTACDRHLGCSARNEIRMRAHPMLRTLMCNTCHTFYNSGEFEKGEDGSELYCRWCGQGGQVYCCSDCPHVFCAKCIKRNMGIQKIREIENTDDWKCFKCEPRCLWDLRALCWALLRYCDLKNRLQYSTEDLKLQEAYKKSCALDESECCKNKINKRKSREEKKNVAKVDVENSVKKETLNSTVISNCSKKETITSAVISKIPPTIQVKKFASINVDELHKKAQKRPGSLAKNSILPANTKFYPAVPAMKKMKMIQKPTGLPISPIRFPQSPNVAYLPKIRPKGQHFPITSMLMNNSVNGFNSTFNNSYNSSGSFSNILTADNINLSLEELTQGLDMATVAAMANNSKVSGNDVVCTPDFPMEPLCEVTEEAPDDDVQCLSSPKVSTHHPPPLVPRISNELPDLSPENIVQMTENDVAVNPATGGLKFRVDPQTLSSNKMYRLPDGRIFAINANPNMPGGYSATIVAVSDNNKIAKAPPKGATYAARLSAVTMTPAQPKAIKSTAPSRPVILKATSKSTKPHVSKNSRECDMKVPIEWYRFNLIDAVDALEYSLSRLQKLRKEATTSFLRTRTVGEMKSLHKILDRVLNTSATRFQEIQENLDKGFKTYIAKKAADAAESISDDDDVEILNDVSNDDPIFIDENSLDSVADNSHHNKTQEIDLTGRASSELNDSADKSVNLSNDKIDNEHNSVKADEQDNVESKTENSREEDQIVSSTAPDVNSAHETKDTGHDLQQEKSEELNTNGDIDMTNENTESLVDKTSAPEMGAQDKEHIEASENLDNVLDEDKENEKDKSDNIENKIVESQTIGENNLVTSLTEDLNQNTDMTDHDTDVVNKSQDPEMTEDIIENLLNDNLGDDIVGENLGLLDIPELQET